ncbi:hypothetical protein [Agromyces terreus]|uniref:hypothetical protein n=1 Tax=Agromyces terreus TaxID=424795 RepID=UPI0031D12220
MSDTTKDPDDSGAFPADEGDATETPSTAQAADAPLDEAAPDEHEPDLAAAPDESEAPADAAPEPVFQPAPEPVVAEPEPEPEAVDDVAAAPEPVEEPEPERAPATIFDAPEPVEEPVADSVDDAEAARTARLDEAVQRANAGAAASDAPLVTPSEPAPVEPVPSEPAPLEPERTPAEPVLDEHDVDAASDTPEALPEPVAADSVRRETYVPPTPEEAAAAAGAATLAAPPVAPQPQTIYVQAPVPPKAKGNRAFGALVAAIGAVAFAIIYGAVSYLLLLGRGDSARATDVFVSFLGSAVFWLPVVAVFLAFALLAAIVNRGPWWVYAVFGLLVGVLVYFSYIGASLLTVQAWTLTFDEAETFISQRWLDPFAIAAGVIAREIPIWFGGWIAARGRTVTERNRLAVEAYDRELAAGPKLAGPTSAV